MSRLMLTELASPPPTPDTGKVRVYVNSGGTLASVDDAGVVTTYGAGVTQEQVEDYVGALLQDSSSVDVTYNDAGNAVTFTVIAGGVNHNALLNYVANQHIDHSTVSINAGTGLTGGGDITASRTISMPNTGTAGTYRSVTTDAQGRVTAGTNPTTLAGYGITDAQPLDSDLTAVAGLAGTGLVTRTGTGTATTRTITAGTYMSISNGDGVSGNPVITHANSAATAGSYGGVNAIPVLGVGATGHIDSVSTVNTTSALLTGFSAAAGTVVGTDTILQAFNKLQGTITAGVANFATDVLNTVLTGLSVVGGSAVTASDSILTAIGKLQGQVNDLIATDNEWIEVNTANTYTNTSNTTGVGVTELDLVITAGRKYYYEATLLYQSAATTTGLAVTVTSPNGASAPGAVMVNMAVAADGTAAMYSGTINTLGDYVTSTGVQTANTPFVCHIKGNFPASASGTLRITFRSEVNGSQVTISPGSSLLVREFV